MSDNFLPKDNAPAQKRRRVEPGEKTTLPLIERMQASREQGLSQAIPASNVGFKLLQRMGYKEGKGLGKTAQGRTKPVEMVIRPRGQGVGEDTRINQEIERLSKQTKEQEEAALSAYLKLMKRRSRFVPDGGLEEARNTHKFSRPSSSFSSSNLSSPSSSWPRPCPLCPSVSLNSQTMAVTHSQGKKHRQRMMQTDLAAQNNTTENRQGTSAAGTVSATRAVSVGSTATKTSSEDKTSLSPLYYLQLFVKLRLCQSLSFSEFDVSGPPHCPMFSVTALLDGEPLSTGAGKSKKEAKQNAAEVGLAKLSSGCSETE
eukprot:gb/GEZN01010593.1/.p1 GENE.gb/GEZN01010593.1/~~gb/GEZN01010593.1/.p1  ORF type:complete len:336 (+),score=57.40 gb/GEZN01010593.1/:65-1009(+)